MYLPLNSCSDSDKVQLPWDTFTCTRHGLCMTAIPSWDHLHRLLSEPVWVISLRHLLDPCFPASWLSPSLDRHPPEASWGHGGWETQCFRSASWKCPYSHTWLRQSWTINCRLNVCFLQNVDGLAPRPPSVSYYWAVGSLLPEGCLSQFPKLGDWVLVQGSFRSLC